MSHTPYEYLANTSLDAYFVIDMAGNILEVNAATTAMYGYSSEELLAITLHDIEAVENREEIRQHMLLVMENGYDRFESRHFHKDGSIIDVEISVSFVAETRTMLAFHRDITQRKRLEKNLQEEKDRFRAFMDNNPAIAWMKDDQFRFVYINKTFEKRFGVRFDDLFGKSDSDCLEQEIVAVFRHNDLVVLNGEQPLEVEEKVIDLAGNTTFLLNTKFMFRNSSGQRFIGGLGFDISEQKRAAVELERYGKIFRYISDMVIVAGRDGLLKDVNPAFARTLGYAEDELNARPLLEFIHPDDHQTTLDELKRQIGGKFDTLNFENRYLCKDGSPRWFSWNAYFEEKEQLFFGIARDITESKKSLEELAFVNECFAQALGGSQHILYRLNVKKGCYDYMSPAFERITGHKVEAFRNNGLDQLKTFFHPDDLDSVFSLIDDRLRTRTGKTVTFEFEYRFRKADGGYCWLHDSNTACFNDNDELECFFGSAHDVTARMEAQAALQGAHDELEVRVSERTRDLMVVTEKLKEMSFELIRAEEKERARIAAELHDEVGQSLLLAKMKMDMLASELNDALQSKLAGEASLLLERSLHDVRNLTFEMRPPLLDSAGIVAALERLGTTLRVDFGLAVDIRCSSEKLPLDREKSYSLFQTLRELLLNVAKHARTDRAELLITVKPAFVSIEVNDNGIGFEYGDRFKLRADDWGFGLFNVQQRIGQMGGEVVIVSTPGRGTSVTLSIPVAER